MLRRAGAPVVEPTDRGRDHVDEVVEPAARAELARCADEFDEPVAVRLAAGDGGELGELLGVRLRAGDRDRQAAVHERIRVLLGVEVGPHERGDKLAGLGVAADKAGTTAHRDVEADRRPAVGRGRGHDDVVDVRGGRLLERHAARGPFAELDDRTGGQKTDQEHRPQPVLEPRSASAGRVRARSSAGLFRLLRHCVSLLAIG